jgi:septal ring factor EnvC (AmiA/AmiB activator)
LPIAAAALVAAVFGSAVAQERTDLKRLEGELETTRARESALNRTSKALAADLAALRKRSIKAARAAQESERKLTEFEERIQTLEEQAAAHQASLRSGRRHAAQTLRVLERMSRNPPQALLLSPDRPIEVVRRAMLLRATLPAIQRRTDDLRAQITALAKTREAIETQRGALKRAQQAYEGQRGILKGLVDKKATIFRRTMTERRRVARRITALTRKARTLRELFDRLEDERRNPPPAGLENRGIPGDAVPATGPGFPKPAMLRRFPESGLITQPAGGRLTRRYGESTGFGNTAKGITLETRATAQVVAPFDGRVVFSGPFRGYGEILIIEHDGGYHSLLAGLARIDGRVGQWILAGEPIGVMAKPSDSVPKLYFELRRRGQSINPLPWLAQYRNNTRG